MRTDRKSEAGGADSTGGAKIIQFKRNRLRSQGAHPVNDPLRHMEDEEDRRRMRQNLGAALVIVVLIIAGFWLIDHLRTSARISVCLEAGHHNCLPLDLDGAQAR
jgi:hypothetical protein